MLLPWSHDTGPLARRSWLTLALISACVVAFLAAGHDPAVAQFERTADEAHAYWQAHPYLEPGDLLAAHYGDDGAAARAEFRASLAAGDVPIPASVLDAEQDELDRLTIAASHALEQHVWYRYGLIPTAPRLEGLFGHLFLHGSWGHLLGNLLFLFLMAPFPGRPLGSHGLRSLLPLGGRRGGRRLCPAEPPCRRPPDRCVGRHRRRDGRVPGRVRHRSNPLRVLAGLLLGHLRGAGPGCSCPSGSCTSSRRRG